MKKVLITGANGQDGKILSEIYHKKKFKVYCLNRRNLSKSSKKYSCIVNNLKSKKKLEIILKKIKPNLIIHLASKNNSFSNRNKNDNYNKYYLENFEMTKNLVDAVVDTKLKSKFIFAGSSLMYEGLKKNIITEKDKFNPISFYGKYKVASYNYIKKRKINSITVILFNHDSKFRSKKFLIPRLINAFKKKDIKFINKIFSFNISGDFSDANDICKGIYKLSLKNLKLDKIILSSGRRFYLNNFIKKLNKKYKLPINKKVISNEYKFIGINKLAKKIINYNSATNLSDILIKNLC